jgi:hypothetical protein
MTGSTATDHAASANLRADDVGGWLGPSSQNMCWFPARKSAISRMTITGESRVRAVIGLKGALFHGQYPSRIRLLDRFRLDRRDSPVPCPVSRCGGPVLFVRFTRLCERSAWHQRACQMAAGRGKGRMWPTAMGGSPQVLRALAPCCSAARGRDVANIEPRCGSRDNHVEIARAWRDAYLSTDLRRPGPSVWPFGRRARERRDRHRAVVREAQRRRTRFRTMLNGHTGIDRPGEGDPAGEGDPTASELRDRQPVDRRTRLVVILGLLAVVAMVMIATVWSGHTDDHDHDLRDAAAVTASPPPAPGSTLDTIADSASWSQSLGSTPSAGSSSLPALAPIPPGGAVAVTPDGGPAIDARSVRVVAPPAGAPTGHEIESPQTAMGAWLSRLCPFSPEDQFGAAEQRARAAMTASGWASLDPFDGDQQDRRARASWDQTVAAGESGRCAVPTTQLSPEAPRSATWAIVIGSANRIVSTRRAANRSSALGEEPYVEQVSAVRVVRRGADGLWRVDVQAEGG